ncbi:universal stress protein [Jiulongibacter sp. NS-SX5]|uniref:universal stress protein n=1 Tax=Jiulongibacter sp. NS-SX5 TaxID=3463854 RepID=UPI004057FADB
MKILIGTDFSKASENAIEFTANWARKFIAEVVLVHAYLPPVTDPSIPVGMIESNQLTVVKEMDQILASKARKLQEKGIRTSYKVVVGDLKYAFEQATEDGEKADLIVLGKSSNPDFLDKLIGSTSQHLLNQIKTPLLVIPETYSLYETTNTAYATQLEFDEKSILSELVNINYKLKSKLHLVKVNTPDDLDINPDHHFTEDIKGIKGLENVEVDYINSKSLKDGLKEYINDHDIDLLVLATHHRGVLDGLLAPSQSRKLLSKIKIPILVYHFT